MHKIQTTTAGLKTSEENTNRRGDNGFISGKSNESNDVGSVHYRIIKAHAFRGKIPIKSSHQEVW